MAEVLLDTNIIIDYLSASRPAHIEASTMMEGILEDDTYKPVMSASSLKDAYYILCKAYHNEPLVRERLEGLIQTIKTKDLTTDLIDAAFASDEPDFEDAIIRATAEKHNVKAIITRDKAAYKNSRIPSMDARAFCYEMD